MKTLIAAIVLAHSWYPSDCCNGKDCFPVPCESIVQDEYGYRYTDPNGKKFWNRNARFSEDGLCHVCIWGQGTGMGCLFIPQPVGS